MKIPLYFPREAARTLLRPPRPSGTKMSGPSQQMAARKEESTDPMLESFSRKVPDPLYILVQELMCSALSATMDWASRRISRMRPSVTW